LAQLSTSTPSNVVKALGVSPSGDGIGLLYRSKRRGHNKLGLALSSDGIEFKEFDAPVLMLGAGKTEDIDKIAYAQLTHVINQRIMTYSRNDRLKIATISELDELGIETWKVQKTGVPKAETGVIVPEFKHNSQYVMYTSHNDIDVSFSKNLKDWQGTWQPPIRTRANSFDNKNIRVISAQVIKAGILVIYVSTKVKRLKLRTSIGAVLFDNRDPAKVLQRSLTPLFETTTGRSKSLTMLGAVASEDEIQLYSTDRSNKIIIHTIINPYSYVSRQISPTMALSRHKENPIIAPEGGQDWESSGTFNPGAVHHEDMFHMFYRAMSPDGVSHFGYASSTDGLEFFRSAKIAYEHNVHGGPPKGMPRRHDINIYSSGGGWGGCEDPRTVIIDGLLYLSFCVFENWGSMRQAVITLSLEDLRNNNWCWSKPMYISPEHQRQKNWMIFPEKINGQFAIVHALTPKIQVEYFDSFEELEDSPIHSLVQGDNDRLIGHGWDGFLRGASAPPIKTDRGWLLFYHGTDPQNPSSGYKLGAMLLDINDPTEIIARTKQPILKPEEWYEHDHKPNVIYASAAVAKDDTLYIYYGGGDRHVCAATTPLKKFVDNLLDC
jgi:predicted GH43/DUF377 family glycosyl hydrolase